VKKPVERPVPVETLLGRLNEILKDLPAYSAKCDVYSAEVGLMLSFNKRTLSVGSNEIKELLALADLVGGALYIGPSDEDVKLEAGFHHRALDVKIQTGPVIVMPDPLCHITSG
jgi:hypothetical protein